MSDRLTDDALAVIRARALPVPTDVAGPMTTFPEPFKAHVTFIVGRDRYVELIQWIKSAVHDTPALLAEVDALRRERDEARQDYAAVRQFLDDNPNALGTKLRAARTDLAETKALAIAARANEVALNKALHKITAERDAAVQSAGQFYADLGQVRCELKATSEARDVQAQRVAELMTEIGSLRSKLAEVERERDAARDAYSRMADEALDALRAAREKAGGE